MYKKIIEYDFAKEYSPFPGPRFESIGGNSGERFRMEVLERFLKDEQPILINVENVKLSFGPSFLSEAFGVFAKKHSLDIFKKIIYVKEDTEEGKRFYIKMMEYVTRELNHGKN